MDCQHCHSEIPDGAIFCPRCNTPIEDKEEPSDYRYAAFISYRHLPCDAEVAQQVQKAIETYRLPLEQGRTKTAKGSRGTLGKCFRDEDELAASSSLPDSIQKALAQSRALIVICSPETETSPWVQREIETFASLHGRERIICVLADGTPSSAIPNILRSRMIPDTEGNMHDFPTEPLAADLRSGTNAKPRDEMLRVIAAVAGCSFDDLKQRDKKRRNKRIAVSAIIACFFVALIGFLSNAAYQNSEEALYQRAKSLTAQAQEHLARGERIQAIETALEALPASESDRSKPLLPEAKQILEDALLINPIPSQTWRPFFALNMQEEVIAYTASCEGHWVAILDKSGKLEVVGMEDGKSGLSFDLTGFTDDWLDFTTEDWLMETVDKSCIILASKNDDGCVLCIDVVEGTPKWSQEHIRTNSIAVSEDHTKVGLLRLVNGTDLHYVVHDAQSGELIGYAGLEFHKDFPIASLVPTVINNEGDTSFVAMQYNILQFNPTMGDNTSPSNRKVIARNPTTLLLDGNKLYAAYFTASENEQGQGMTFEICAWDTGDLSGTKLWSHEGTYDFTLIGTKDKMVGMNGVPAICDTVQSPSKGILCKAGKALYTYSSSGKETYQESFGSMIVDARAQNFSDDGDFISIVLTDGTLILRSPTLAPSGQMDPLTFKMPYQTDQATIFGPEDNKFGSFVVVGRSATDPSRIFAYCFDTRVFREPEEFTLDELIEVAQKQLV